MTGRTGHCPVLPLCAQRQLPDARVLIAAIPAKAVPFKEYGLHRGAGADFLLAKADASTASWPAEHRICGFSDTLVSQTKIGTVTCGGRSILREPARNVACSG
ncbi:hypothetical protein [Brucella intermedia]|uniref:hypothetical protein n=1 Tax=Brucella intermedia TaxID=94625 RepID=UPI00124F74F3|nr:hypothetical protein [Brucella intermedia]KAB2715499.1 hypothetical protein F9K75_17745 [Brucella intermedia]KAB2719131.1 hypothetical protein F9K73_15985 [Brucella intermedia]